MYALTETFETSAGPVAAGSTGHGPPLVLAHGWPWSSYSWHRVIPKLSKSYTLFFYDMPGYGRSHMSADQPTGLDVQGRIMAEMFDHWGLEAPQVVAHDFGGAVTLRAHLLEGRELGSLVLMNIVAMRPWGSDFFAHVGRHVDAFTGLPDHIHAAVAEAYIRGAFAHPIAEEDVTALLAPWLSPEGRASFYRQFGQADEAFTAEFEPHLRNIRCPVTVLWGEDDPWIPLSRGQELAQRIGQGPLHPLPGLGHLPQLENPDLVARNILNSLEKHAEEIA